MQVDILADISKLCADFLRDDVSSELKATHARELVAAFSGYKSHAALLAEEDYPLFNLEDADVLIPNITLLEARRKKLNGLPATLPESRILAEKIAGFLRDEGHFSGDVWLCDSLADYVTDVLLPDEEACVMDELAGVMAGTNAIFDEIYYGEAEVNEEKDRILITATGQLNGSIQDDRPFNGNQIDMTVTIELLRIAGRAAFASAKIEAGGRVNDDWRKHDLDN